MPASSAASAGSSWAAHGLALVGLAAGWSSAEVRARRRLDAVGAVAEVDRVEVVAQDPLLGPLARELVGQRGLAQLLEQRAVVLGGERVLDELLRDRRAALHAPAGGDVLPQGAADAAQVDALVRVEAAVLDRDDRLLHRPARSGPRTRGARSLPVSMPSSSAVAVEDHASCARRTRVLELRQVGGDRHHHPEHGRDDGQHRRGPTAGAQRAACGCGRRRAVGSRRRAARGARRPCGTSCAWPSSGGASSGGAARSRGALGVAHEWRGRA